MEGRIIQGAERKSPRLGDILDDEISGIKHANTAVIDLSCAQPSTRNVNYVMGIF